MTNLLDTDTRAARTTADILDFRGRAAAGAPGPPAPRRPGRRGLTAAVVAAWARPTGGLEQPRTEPTVRAVVQTDPVSDQDPALAAAPFSPYADWHAAGRPGVDGGSRAAGGRRRQGVVRAGGGDGGASLNWRPAADLVPAWTDPHELGPQVAQTELDRRLGRGLRGGRLRRRGGPGEAGPIPHAERHRPHGRRGRGPRHARAPPVVAARRRRPGAPRWTGAHHRPPQRHPLGGSPDAARRTRTVLEALAAFDPAPDVVLVTGDVADHGTEDEYAEAQSVLGAWPGPAPLLVCPGTTTCAPPTPGGGAARRPARQRGAPRRRVLFCLLDSLAAGTPERASTTASSPRRRWPGWTAAARAPGERAVVCLHHPPVAVGID
ncbi:MAG: hypothetical protein R2734_04530 [Nocardioides sp.]